MHRSLGAHVSKVRSLTLDRLDENVLRLLQEIGNRGANEVLCANAGENRISPESAKEERVAFIQRKYGGEFLGERKSERIDVVKAVKECRLMDVYRAICYGQMEEKENKYGALHAAASIGNKLIVELIALNTANIDCLDQKGWSALSFAAYYGNIGAAEVLISLGANPNVNPETHPYKISMQQGNYQISTLFLPYWEGGHVDKLQPGELKPPVPIGNQPRRHQRVHRKPTCDTITILNSVGVRK